MVTPLIKKFILVVSFSLVGAACSDDAGDGESAPPDAAPPTAEIKVASSWNSAGDLQALQVALGAFSDETSAIIDIIPLASDSAERTEQFQGGDWELGQENVFRMQESFDDGNGGLTSVDLATVASLEESLASIYPEIMAELTLGSRVMGFPMNVHRENTLIYSKSLVSTPPADLAELQQVCTDYVDGGKTGPRPMAVASADWVNRIVFQSMLPANVLGGTKSSVQEAEVKEAFAAALDVIGYYYANDCFLVAPSEHGWDEAAQSLVDGEAMMFIHGDWAKGYLTRVGWTPGTDFGVTPAPGSDGAFHYGVDTFSVNDSSANKDLALEFARIALTPAVQVGFSQIKGSTPAIEIPNAAAVITDPALLASYNDLNAARDADGFVAVPSWIGSNGPLILPVVDASKTSEEIASDFYAVYPE